MTSDVVTPSQGVRVSTSDGAAPEPTTGEGVGSGVSADEYAAAFRMALDVADHGKARSMQTDGGILGASDFGSCVHKAVLTVRRTPPSNVPRKGRARIGTALHAVFLENVQALYPHRIIETELTVTLPSGRQVPLHPDEIDPTEPSVTDYKFVKDLAYIRKVGVSDNQHMQRNLQYLAAHQAGLVPAQGIVRNIFVSMHDADDVWVQQEPFSMEWVERADEWGHAVAYAVEHDEDGSKDWPANMCRDYCPFFDLCKPPLLDASGHFTSRELLLRAQTAMEAKEQREHFEQVEKEAKEVLRGVSGRAGDVQVVSTWVNSGKGYFKVDLRRIK